VDLAEKVSAVLKDSIIPAVIARGGEIRVLSVTNGVVTLALSGSPGASVPLLGRIEAKLRAAFPEITEVQVIGLGSDSLDVSSHASLREAVSQILEREINPIIAAHRGHVTLLDVEKGWARIRLEGGCQGCSLAEVTVRQGIEPMLRARVPGIVGVADATDHAAGREPFYSAAKR
jgi:Fe-S cluster biogenesis protein NfuA